MILARSTRATWRGVSPTYVFQFRFFLDGENQNGMIITHKLWNKIKFSIFRPVKYSTDHPTPHSRTYDLLY